MLAGYIFVALKGQKLDGKDFITEAQKNGAILILAENLKKENVISLKEGMSRKIYSLLLSCFHEKQPKQIIGVTGTNGKTSVVFFINSILNKLNNKSGIIGTLGSNFKNIQSNLTTPDPLHIAQLLQKFYKLCFMKIINLF